MQNFKKSLIAVFLVIVLFMTACSKASPTEEPGEVKESNGQTAENKEEISSNTKITLRIMIPVGALEPPEPNDKLIFQRWEEATGIHIDWITIPSDIFGEKRNLAFTSGELPDAIFNAGIGEYDLQKLGADGQIIPLNDIIEKYMPNFKKVLVERPIYEAMITAPDGNIYALPWIEELGWGKENIHSVNGIPYINVEWLQKLGLKMPETTDDLKNVLKAFKQHDPAGGGKTIPMSFINSIAGNEDLGFIWVIWFGDKLGPDTC